MKESIRLEKEKARWHGKVYNWETAKYGKILYDEDVHDLKFVEIEFPALVFNDELLSEKTLFCEPTVRKLVSKNGYDVLESIDSDFARFNNIITSLKALDEGFSSKNYVRKFLRALHPKWKVKVTGKKERVKFIALKAKKESIDDETSTSGSDDEEYAMAVRNFKKFFRGKDVVIQSISLAIVQYHLATKIKRPSLEVLGAIAKMTPKTKPTMKLVSWLNRRMSANSLRDMLNNQKSPSCKIGLGFDSEKASTGRTKTMSFVGSFAKKGMDGSTIKVHGSTLPGFVSRIYGEKGIEHFFIPPISSRSDFVITRKKLIHNSIAESKKPSLKPSPKSGIGYVKNESRSKTPPPRSNIPSQPRYNTPQSRRNSR
nr:hypothetical protein [Tanacetum cinerariifolium]